MMKTIKAYRKDGKTFQVACRSPFWVDVKRQAIEILSENEVDFVRVSDQSHAYKLSKGELIAVY